MTTKQAFELAAEHHRAGRLAEAEGLYGQIISQQPHHAGALHMLGIVHCQTARFISGENLLRRAISIRPDVADAHRDLGNALTAQGKPAEGIVILHEAIRLNPANPKSYSALAMAFTALGQFDEAISACHQAIKLKPDYPAAYDNLGNALRAKGQFNESIAAFRQVISLTPNFAGGYVGLGNILSEIGQLDDAIAAYRQAIVLRPEYAEAFSNLGNVLISKGRVEEAINACRRGVELNPDLPAGHSLLGLVLLLTGQFREGWNEYDYRLLVKDFPSLITNIKRPLWDGSKLPNGTIFIHAEQGFGDTFQFIRYIPMVAERCAKVVVICHPEELRVLHTMGTSAQWITPADPFPQFDVHCPLLSLPRIFDATLEAIPAGVPYLFADAAKAERWRHRVAAQPAGLKVGLAWAGRPTHPRDRNRSIQLSSLAALAQVKEVQFYSLQKGEAAKQSQNPPTGMSLIDWTDDLADFSDTAALIANLDLVIAADTAVVHLAGAMGKPVWTLLPFAPDWRWLLERDDTPWYPTMRLFRQPAIGDWESVARKAAGALERGSVSLRFR